MIERTALFGESRNLLGVITQPGSDAGTSGEPAFILLNAGVIHRIGPGRLNVKLARRLALAGFTSLRFDLSGIGDSRAAQSTRAFEAQAVADIQAAMDHLEAACGLRRVVIVGLCSGADNGYAAALEDSRVVGLGMLDPNAYPTWQTRPRFLLRALADSRWRAQSLERYVGRLLGRKDAAEGLSPKHPPVADAAEPGRYVRPKPPLAQFARGLATVIDRQCAVMTVYSGSSLRLFSYERQLDDALRPFNLSGRIRCRLLVHANHTFTEVSAQAELIALIVEWGTGIGERLRIAAAPAAGTTAGGQP